MSTPLKSIRKYCLSCMGGNAKEVKLCPSTDCPFYKYRMNKRRPKLKEIRKFCFGCGEDTAQAVKNCKFPDCELYEYRLGKNPKLKGKGGNIENLRPFMKERRLS